MLCPTCSRPTSVLDTRQRDGGHRVDRRRQCERGHVFVTVEASRAVFNLSRQRSHLQAIAARTAREARNDAIMTRLAAGEHGKDVARDVGLSPSLVSWIAKKTRTA